MNTLEVPLELGAFQCLNVPEVLKRGAGKCFRQHRTEKEAGCPEGVTETFNGTSSAVLVLYRPQQKHLNE